MLFKSPEPFGVAALVAYIASLSLTIILFSLPYFASYFINYNKKLMQIEEAILLLSDQNQTRTSYRRESLPPYSAVSLLDEPELKALPEVDLPEQERNCDDTTEASPSPPPDADNMEEPARDEVAADEIPLKRPTKSRRKETPLEFSFEQDAQLSLFGDSIEGGTLDDSPNESESAAVDLPATVIRAYALLEAGQQLFVRGDPPFSWKEGKPMLPLEVGKFALEAFDIESSIEVCFCVNDNYRRRRSARQRIEPGTVNECYPEV